MSEEVQEPEVAAFEPYPCSLGTVTGVEGDSYLINTVDGRLIGIRANGEPSAGNIEADIASPKPAAAPVVSMTPLQILERLTAEEEAALANSTDLYVQVIRNRLISASEVRSDDPRTGAGAMILVDAGIITAERAAQIFPL